ncbi:MAG: hypothetical protein KDD22_02885 [Bdellovibrionales bacterium]|nr:hypothetical protein [Bdellovibrionales bacterium]
MKVAILLSVGVIWLTGCGNYKEIKKTPENLTIQGKTTDLDFETIKKNILEPMCMSCHTGRHAAFQNYGMVKASAAEILERVKALGNRRMPPVAEPQLDSQSLAQLEEWIEAGAPQFSKPIGPAPEEPKPASVGFEDIRKSIFVPYHCMDCHAQFRDYNTAKKSALSILGSIDSGAMPFPRRKGLAVEPVTSELKEMLKAWVEQGTPEKVGERPSEVIDRPLEPTWVSLRNNVFGPKCILCHNSYGPRAPKAFGTFTEMIAFSFKDKGLFNQGSPIDSHLIGAILGRVDDDEFYFNSMPYNTPSDDIEKKIEKVTDVELEMIQQWIALGTPYSREDSNLPSPLDDSKVDK